jgi:hypothetical protein
MSFEEKLTWVNTVTTAIVAAVYAWIVVGQIAASPVTDIAYQKPMIIALGAIVVLTIAGAIATAIGTAVGVKISGEGSIDDIDRKDERDVHINRRGDLVGYYVSSGLMLGAFTMTMLEFPHFWIANAMFVAFVVAGLTSSAVKLVAYHRGF